MPVEDCNKSLEIKPAHGPALRIRDLAHASMGFFERAIADADQAVRIMPNSAHPYIIRGWVHFLNNHRKQALLNVKRAEYLSSTLKSVWSDKWYSDQLDKLKARLATPKMNAKPDKIPPI